MDHERWIDLAKAACDHAGIDCRSIETLVTWDEQYCANAVYRIDEAQYLKVFGPTAERQFHVERSVLRTLGDHDAIPAPRIVAEAERQQEPPYLVMTEIPGSTAEQVWEDLSRAEQLAIAGEIGTITAAIHRLPRGNLAPVERQFGGRNAVIRQWQSKRIAEIEEAGLTARQREDLLHFVKVEAPTHIDTRLGLSHHEMAHNHIYLSRDSGNWRVSGIIDWADVVVGPVEWDVSYLWQWTFSYQDREGTYVQDREAMETCLATLFAGSSRPERFARRCLAALVYTPSMMFLWPYFIEQAGGARGVVQEMTEFFFPADVFGPPD